MTPRLERLLQLLQAGPTDAFVLFALAKEYEGADKLEEALHYYLQLQQTDPDYVGLYYHLGKIYERRGHHDQAVESYRRGIDVARRAGDMHALSELNAARLEIDDSDD